MSYLVTSALQLQEQHNKQRLHKLLLEKKRLRGLQDLHFFNKYILNYKDLTGPDRFHGELCQFVEDEKKKKLLILEPRGSLKSSCITIGYVVQQIIKNPNIRVLIASEEFLTAKKFLAEIKGHFEKNKELIRLYGTFMSKAKWSESEIIVRGRTKESKEPTVTCAGIDVTKVGMHYDLIVVDDPHSDKNVSNMDQIDKVIRWFKLLLSLLDPGKKLVVIGTIWHYDDLFNWIQEQEHDRKDRGLKKRFHILKKKAAYGPLRSDMPDSLLLWPERLTAEFLIDTKLDQGPYIFSCQYLNEPVDDEAAVFKKSWVRFYDPELTDLSKWPKYSMVDPIIDEEGRDWAVITTVAMDTDWVMYVLEVRRGKWNESDLIDQIFKVYDRWKPEKIGLETTAWQKLLGRFTKAEMVRRGKYMPIRELGRDTSVSKAMRIKSMVPYWRSGFFRVPGESVESLQGNMAIFINELLRYPKLKNDDCIDSLAYSDHLVQRPLVSKIRRIIPRGSFKAIKERHGTNSKKKLGRHNRIGV